MNEWWNKKPQSKVVPVIACGWLLGVMLGTGWVIGVEAFSSIADEWKSFQQGGYTVAIEWLGQTYQFSLQPDGMGQHEKDPVATAAPLSAQALRKKLEAESTLFSDGVVRYAYASLTDAEKITYLLIAQCSFAMEEQVELPAQASVDLQAVWPLVRSDFPELFWVDTVLARTVTTGEVQQTYFVPSYALTTVERAAQEATIQQAAALYQQTLPENATEYQKVKAAYEFVVGHVDYVKTEYDQTLYGALGQGEAVCAGYARAVQYLLGGVGVCCGYVSGQAIGDDVPGLHAWNFVQIEGEYYYLDATWGDSAMNNRADYAYLCVNAVDFATDHFAKDVPWLPSVEGVKYNYYRVEGFYLEQYSLEAAQAALALQVGNDYYTLRFSNAEELQAACVDLFETKKIYGALRAVGMPAQKVGYTCQDTVHVLTIYPRTE